MLTSLMRKCAPYFTVSPLLWAQISMSRFVCQSFTVRISSSGQCIFSMPECHYLCVSLRHLTLMYWSRKLCSKPNERSYNIVLWRCGSFFMTQPHLHRWWEHAMVWLSCQLVFKLLLIQTTKLTPLTDAHKFPLLV